MKRYLAREERPTTTNLNGFSPEVLSSAETLRQLICEWQRRGLDSVMPQLGHYDESSKRPFKRSDLLALEAIRHGKDVPESGPQRDQVVQEVLSLMRREGTWASTPEYIALSIFTKCHVEIWTWNPERSNIVVRDSFKSPKDESPTIRLFFDRHHYDLLVSDDEHKVISEWFPRQVPSMQSIGIETLDTGDQGQFCIPATKKTIQYTGDQKANLYTGD